MSPIYFEAVQRFRQLLERAQQLALTEPLAMTLATASCSGKPSARVVLLRGLDERGFVFYTNTESDKGRQLTENPQAALCFHWDALAEQVRVEGRVEQVASDDANAYWAGRSRESKIGAWASAQSRTLDSRHTLEERIAEYEQRFAGQEVPRPPHWTGYRLRPERIEFWKGQPARLHERWVYERQGTSWSKRMLYP